MTMWAALLPAIGKAILSAGAGAAVQSAIPQHGQTHLLNPPALGQSNVMQELQQLMQQSQQKQRKQPRLGRTL